MGATAHDRHLRRWLVLAVMFASTACSAAPATAPTTAPGLPTMSAPTSIATPPVHFDASLHRVLPRGESTADRLAFGRGVFVAAGPAGLVALAAPSEMGAVVWPGLLGWISRDGRQWDALPSLRSLPAPDAKPSADRSWLLVDLAASEDRYLMVLTSGPCTSPASVILTSRDGREWSQIATNLPDEMLVTRVAPTAHGFLAAVTPCLNRERRSSDVAQVWQSIDGATWNELLELPAPLDTVAIGVDGTTTAILGTSSDNRRSHPRLWIARTGAALHEIGVPDAPDGLTQVAVNGEQIVVAGCGIAGYSDNGADWTIESTLLCVQIMRTTAHGLIAIGATDHGAAIAWMQSGSRWASTTISPNDVNEPPRVVPFIEFGSIAEIGGTIVIGGAGSAETIGAKGYPEPRIWIVETSA